MVKKRKSWINIRDIAWLKAQVYKIRRNRQSFKIERNKHGYHICCLKQFIVHFNSQHQCQLKKNISKLDLKAEIYYFLPIMAETIHIELLAQLYFCKLYSKMVGEATYIFVEFLVKGTIKPQQNFSFSVRDHEQAFHRFGAHFI